MNYRNLGRTGMMVSPLCLYPAVTAPIIGPRTMEQLGSQLGAEELTLTADVLDRIDEIVPPGTNVAPGQTGYVAPAVADPALRRR